MKFRFDINALRAIAVLGVVFFHYKIPFFTGGFAGVDVFFVISGYLMSKIIVDGIQQKKFSVLLFYSKRLKRIAPPLLSLIFVLTILGFVFYLPLDFQQNSKNAAVSIAFISNIFYWKHSNYFDPSSDNNLFLHTWSLSLEWQFYLIFPIILYTYSRFTDFKKKYIVFFALSSIVLFAVSIISSSLKPSASFYLLPTRSWELLFGGLAFLFEEIKLKNNLRKVMAITGYGAIFLCFCLLRNEMLWPGFWTLVPVLATAIVIIANYNDLKLIKTNIVQFFGKMSYSLYLWHWPLYVFAAYFGLHSDVTMNAVLLIGLSLIFAYFSFRYVESGDNLSEINILTMMTGMVILTLLASFVNLNSFLFKKETIKISNYNKDHIDERRKQFSSGCCFIASVHSGFKDYDKTSCLSMKKGMKNILLIGDSHAAHLSESLKNRLSTNNINVAQASASGCLPVIRTNERGTCSEMMNYIYNDFIRSNAYKLDGVIISANWVDSGTDHNALIEELSQTIIFLKKHNLKYIIIGQNETYTMAYPSIAAREYESNLSLRKEYSYSFSERVNLFLKKNLGSYYIDIYNIVPDTEKVNGTVPYMSDRNHFTKYGSDLVIQKLMANRYFIDFLN